MTLSTLPRFLWGDRQAILEIAASPRAVWLGGIFVLSAAFAREYDGHDLMLDPWHLLLPFVASLVTSLFLLLVATIAFYPRENDGQARFRRVYRSFLGLYWTTAPLAWLYAIPVERLMGPLAAVEANLWLLLVVSVWRVTLMTRVVSVFFNVSVLSALAVVGWFAATVALAALGLASRPRAIVEVMGGITLTEAEQLVATVSNSARQWIGILWPVCLVGYLMVLVRGREQSTASLPELCGGQVSRPRGRWRPSAWGSGRSFCRRLSRTSGGGRTSTD